MKRRPCQCFKPILWELNSLLMQTVSSVPINLHRRRPRGLKRSIGKILRFSRLYKDLEIKDPRILILAKFKYPRNQVPIMYSLPSQWVLFLFPGYSLPLGTKYLLTLHQSVAQNLSDMCHSTSEIGAALLRSVTEIAPKSPFLCVNRSLVWFSCGCKSYALQCEHA